MCKDILFMPLGGAQKVGASCYYLRLGNRNIILDAGIGKEKNTVVNPVFSNLTTIPSFYSLAQIDQIYVSHAHSDHTGYLSELISEAPQASIYMTEITKALSELQIYDRIYLGSNSKLNEMKRHQIQTNFNKITSVNYGQTLKFSDYKVTFFPAGHLPGAMMTLFEFGNRRILYTGDFSVDSSPLCPPCFDMSGKKIDTVIMCGLHAKHPNYIKKTDKIFSDIENTLNYVSKYRRSVQCYVPQLSKGIEILQMINEKNTNHIPIFIDQNILQVVTKMEEFGIKILSPDNKLLMDNTPNYPHILLTSKKSIKNFYYSETKTLDITLHEDFKQMKSFIENINPKQVVMVHCGKQHHEYDTTIEQEILCNSDCKASFIFAEEQEIYKL